MHASSLQLDHGNSAALVTIPCFTSDMLMNEKETEQQIAQVAGNSPLVVLLVESLAVDDWFTKDPDGPRRPDETHPDMWLMLFVMQACAALDRSQTLAVVLPESARPAWYTVCQILDIEEKDRDSSGVFFTLDDVKRTPPGSGWMKCGPMKLF